MIRPKCDMIESKEKNIPVNLIEISSKGKGKTY